MVRRSCTAVLPIFKNLRDREAYMYMHTAVYNNVGEKQDEQPILVDGEPRSRQALGVEG